MLNINQQSLKLHRKHQGKVGTVSLLQKLKHSDLSLAYTPGVAEPCRVIDQDATQAYNLTLKGRTVAIISDGSAVLGLGNIGAAASLPVMEGKALLMKEFGGIDAFPIVINSQTPQEIIQFVKAIAPTFAGINLEDIAAPACFQIEDALQDIGIPVFHDDQHGTAIVVRAALLNAAKVINVPFESLKVVVVGAGAAGLSIARTLLGLDCHDDNCRIIEQVKKVLNVILVDTQGAIVEGRTNLNIYKQTIARASNFDKRQGKLDDIIDGAHVVIGVSGPGTISPHAISKMAKNPVVFAMANPTPEIMPGEALLAGAAIIATGRSDFPNQINNVLAFPGVFRAVVKGRLNRVTHEMKHAASEALASLITDPNPENIIPSAFHPNLAEIVAEAILSSSEK